MTQRIECCCESMLGEIDLWLEGSAAAEAPPAGTMRRVAAVLEDLRVRRSPAWGDSHLGAHWWLSQRAVCAPDSQLCPLVRLLYLGFGLRVCLCPVHMRNRLHLPRQQLRSV